MKTSEMLVFDIKRFAVHDGAGIRTTVFFKGCPLRCKWCQNPEGLEAKRQPVFLKKQCIGCKSCVMASKKQEVTWENGPVLNRNADSDFEEIARICPAAAIRFDSEPFSTKQLLERILDDRVFYRDNGGVTFSGGEPFLQKENLIEILKACHEEGIHTAIESSFYADPDLVRQAAENLDQIYCDIKLFDENRHREMTGVSNERILQNIRWLLENPEHRNKVTVRTPLIPGCTDDEENIARIAGFISSIYPEVKYELLNYNPLAGSKYEMTGRTYTLNEAKPLSKAQLNVLQQTAADHGIKHLIKA